MKAKAERKNEITRGTRNVFADLGFGAREASELRVKAELTRQIVNRIKSLALTQVQASHRLSISQPDVSKLKNGRVTGYSTDRLIALLNALGVDVEIVVRPRKRNTADAPGIVKVQGTAA
jgi:predicted XRE-type DNA-binding protein